MTDKPQDSYSRLIACSIIVEDQDAPLSKELILAVAERMGIYCVKGLNMTEFSKLAGKCYREHLETAA